ncbi:MAG: hypothetical protein J5861_01935 [Desulfovibrio sp.]|nr:hypothetical protein [Desulfovibrio sp.]
MSSISPDLSSLISAASHMDDDVTAQPSKAYWPQWVEEFRVDDNLLSAAYEGTPARLRASIKTGLALSHMRFGESTEEHCRLVRNTHLGFWRSAHSLPVPWSVVVFSPTYAAAARLTAACAAAMLGGVTLIGAVCVGGTPTKAAMVSLELSGVEDIFTLPATDLLTLLAEISPGPGRLVLLHTGEMASTSCSIRALNMKYYEECHPPTLALPQPDIFDLEALAFAQAEAFQTVHDKTSPVKLDAIYVDAETAYTECLLNQSVQTPLILTPGCEGFWLHSGLTPDFFRIRQESLGIL